MESDMPKQWSRSEAVAVLKRVKEDLLIVMIADVALHEGHTVTFDSDAMWAMAALQAIAFSAPSKAWLLSVGEEAGIDMRKAIKEVAKFQADINSTLYRKMGIVGGTGQKSKQRTYSGLTVHDWLILVVIILLSLALGRF